MIKKIFFLTIIAFITGCVSSIKHPTNMKKSFVKIHKSVKIKICGENSQTKTNECKKLMTMNSTGSGGIIWNEREIGKLPRTLVLTADHLCEDEKFSIKADIIDKNGYNVPVFEVKVSKDVILFDQNKDLLMQEKETVSVDGVNGPALVLGSLEDVSTNGNWPTTFDVDRK